MARIGKEWTVSGEILEEALMWQLYKKGCKSMDALRYEVQDGDQKEGIGGKFKIRFTKWKLPFCPCYPAFLWRLIVKD